MRCVRPHWRGRSASILMRAAATACCFPISLACDNWSRYSASGQRWQFTMATRMRHGTNLIAATRLVTAWDTEPAEISHLIRFAMTKLVFESTWQALQTNNWPEKRLAQLQAEWEGADFFSHLPETEDFRLASDAAQYEFERSQRSNSPQPIGPAPPSLIELVLSAIRSPRGVWSEVCDNWEEIRYLRVGQYEEERQLLVYDSEREVELRNAVRAPTWAQMSGLPGVTNKVPFPGKSRRPPHNISMAIPEAGGGFLGHAAQAEAQRRILITALALERYHARHGAYPKALADLAPEFVTSEPTDFMDGRRCGIS